MAQTRTPHSAFGALALFAAAVAWPSFVGAAANLGMSPLERGLRESWCGVAPHPDFALLGHCPACWVGVAVLAGAGAMLLRASSPPVLPSRPRLRA
jgi:hypothetical protein